MSDLEEHYLEKDKGPFWKIEFPLRFIFMERFTYKSISICGFKVIQRYATPSYVLCHMFV